MIWSAPIEIACQYGSVVLLKLIALIRACWELGLVSTDPQSEVGWIDQAALVQTTACDPDPA